MSTDHIRDVAGFVRGFIDGLKAENHRFRSRITTLEKEAQGLCTEASFQTDCAKQAEQRVAELEKELQNQRAAAFRHHERAEQALARSESATPAKHPDAERLDCIEQGVGNHHWLVCFDNKSGEVSIWRCAKDAGGHSTLRAAIDAARKQGGQ